MKLIEALNILKPLAPDGEREVEVGLACGFTPAHLELFLAAHLRRNEPNRRAVIRSGLFGDCLGNVERLVQAPLEAAAVIVEWSDLDLRLGLRHLGGWGIDTLADILETAAGRATQLADAIGRAATTVPLALCLPTLPLPPAAFTPPHSSSALDLGLRELASSFAARVAQVPGVRVVNDQRLGELSPLGDRLDVRTELSTGFPYRLAHASAVAELLAKLIWSPSPMKGVITDLDDTLWQGIVGDVGVDAIAWDLDHHAQVHGLYQQMLASLAETGVLIAVASKNDCRVVDEAFRREDLLLKKERVFPVEVGWGAKSEAVCRILRAWNIGAESVVFIDDSPMELAEVAAAHPGLLCLPFVRNDESAIYALLVRLRELFGKHRVSGEDALRLESLRHSVELFGAQDGQAPPPERFLEQAGAEIVIDGTKNPPNPRALELINKTNQFNLNGRRFAEGEWLAHLRTPGAFLLLVSYKDKFGVLGTIAALTGRIALGEVVVNQWVMSCRAFSRRIEYRCLETLFEVTAADRVEFEYQATPKNRPLRDFLTGILGEPPTSRLRLSSDQFWAQCPPLYHHVQGADSWLIREPA
ncbi:HAD-IIIC family phosphatase [Singulisphaera acidiphila]|uniref:Subfamily IIIC HAD-superfamily phosphatase n=1 Tax=Singulisphaera acidiphila (strain ATCC BAA-1392 / DSM 18658 / VKM B-2454 / MOB10) TaxID=886293 RepID=L0DBN8_SINAD|nr:HAD-IIIC family phosphatase [Singulisphaera acidiphila]AGA26789.1 subfamily IIIC HAD-superfamily phosphatase [Singulisphaera acidiphila DSM 18658]